MPGGDAGAARTSRGACGKRARRAAEGGGVDALMLEFRSIRARHRTHVPRRSLLRIPDATRDLLIRDKLGRGDWHAHVGRSPSLFVNARVGLLVTGRLSVAQRQRARAALASLLRKGGEPLVRKGVDLAMRLLGKQFVLGRTIEALGNTRAACAQLSLRSTCWARPREDDALAIRRHAHAIRTIGAAAASAGVMPGTDPIKLSALHPRYVRAQRPRVRGTAAARDATAQLTRKDSTTSTPGRPTASISPICSRWRQIRAHWMAESLRDAVYQKRCPAVVDWLVDLARRSQHRLMVRLVKGAYWDSEIKRAQQDGLDGYPVYTRKAYTDVAYIACARKLLAAPDAVYPQFATHNAQTLASVHRIALDLGATADDAYEFQCLHGMGEPLYEQVVGVTADGGLGRACRIYAPVGTHETLLAYLVRRLLENGANTSFVNRIVDLGVPTSRPHRRSVALAELTGGTPSRMPLPCRHPPAAAAQPASTNRRRPPSRPRRAPPAGSGRISATPLPRD
jgi:RHH-type proline utilization regulon transcriptional repressor/proline dehydrogenase/delta 1-pyrroline-5-carboxylate dehydrogenase